MCRIWQLLAISSHGRKLSTTLISTKQNFQLNCLLTPKFVPMVEKQNGGWYTLRDRGKVVVRNLLIKSMHVAFFSPQVCRIWRLLAISSRGRKLNTTLVSTKQTSRLMSQCWCCRKESHFYRWVVNLYVLEMEMFQQCLRAPKTEFPANVMVLVISQGKSLLPVSLVGMWVLASNIATLNIDRKIVEILVQ